MNDKFFSAIDNALQNPLIPHEPMKQSLKQWAMFVLRDKGFKVVYAQNADFAVEYGGEKIYFKVANTDQELQPELNWIVWYGDTKKVRLITRESFTS